MQGKEQLSGLKFFKGVRRETLERLWQEGRAEQFRKGHLVYRAREANSQICIQLKGKSAIYNLTHAGKRKIIFIFGEGQLLNEHVLLDHVTSVYCEAIEASRIFLVPADVWVREMEADFSLVKAVLEAQEVKIWRLAHQLKNTTGGIYMERKLAAKLWKLSRDFGKPVEDGVEIDINLPITFLADMLGTPRETASRLCNILVGYGLIKIERRRITITDPEKMALFYKNGEKELFPEKTDSL